MLLGETKERAFLPFPHSTGKPPTSEARPGIGERVAVPPSVQGPISPRNEGFSVSCLVAAVSAVDEHSKSPGRLIKATGSTLFEVRQDSRGEDDPEILLIPISTL